MAEIVRLGDIPRDVLDQVENDLLQYSVGLFRGQGGAQPNEMDLVGSGTLIQVGNLYAILTADHVLGCLQGTEKDCERVGAVGLGFAHPEETYEDKPLIIPMEELLQSRMVQIARNPQKRQGEGPDLGAIFLPNTYISRIEKEKSFYNLSEAHEKIRSASSTRGGGLRLIFGFPGAETQWETIVDSDNYIPRFCQNALWGGTEQEPYANRDGFDYFKIQIGEKEAKKLPKTIGGTSTLGGISGGGIWHVPVMKNREYWPDLMIKSSVLCGVAFAEGRLVDKGHVLYVKCHGWRSVYNKAYPFLADLAP
jgi:hypothetical protein